MKNPLAMTLSLSSLLILGACGGGDSGDSATVSTPAAQTTVVTPATTTTPTTPATPTTPTTPTTSTTTPTVSTAAKYAGTFSGCEPNGTAGSVFVTLVVTAQNATTAAFSNSESAYNNTTCAGTAAPAQVETGTVTFSGTKVVGADTVDKGVVARGTVLEKQIFLIKGTPPALYLGRSALDGGAVDAEGYPVVLDTAGIPKK